MVRYWRGMTSSPAGQSRVGRRRDPDFPGRFLRLHAEPRWYAFLCVLPGLALPFTPLGAAVGFIPPPPLLFAYLVLAVGTYLLLVQFVKTRFCRRYPLT